MNQNLSLTPEIILQVYLFYVIKINKTRTLYIAFKILVLNGRIPVCFSGLRKTNSTNENDHDDGTE